MFFRHDGGENAILISALGVYSSLMHAETSLRIRRANKLQGSESFRVLERAQPMREQFVEIKTAEGVMEAFVTQPEQGGPFPAVILYMDIWGVREELYDIARRVGTVGYYCLVPDLYYRAGKRIHYDFRNPKNQTISMNRLDRGSSKGN